MKPRKKPIPRDKKSFCSAALQLLAGSQVQTRSLALQKDAAARPDRRRIRWNMGPCQHNTWMAALAQLDLEAEVDSLRQWRGFQIGSNCFIVRMNVEFCHDKHQLAKVLQEVPSAAVWLPETYLSIEDFVNSGQHEGTSSWFLKISDVDYGCGVRSFRCPVQREELRQLLELSRREAQQALGQLRRAKGCKPRELGDQIVIQKAIKTSGQVNYDQGFPGLHYKEDLRVYVCCSVNLPHQVFVYRRLGLRRAPKPLDGTLDREVQCTHYGHITPSESVTEWPLYDVMFPQICEAVKNVMTVVTPELEDRCCVLLGMDFICDDRPYLLEINQVPRLCYDDPRVQAWTQRMAVEFLRLVVLGSVETNGWVRL